MIVQKRRRAGRIALWAIPLLALAVVLLAFAHRPQRLHIDEVVTSDMRDGEYFGEAENGLVKAKVMVRLLDGKITEITVLEHDCMLGKPAESIADEIVRLQTLYVEAVAGATYSSDTIRKAVETALRNGG